MSLWTRGNYDDCDIKAEKLVGRDVKQKKKDKHKRRRQLCEDGGHQSFTKSHIQEKNPSARKKDLYDVRAGLNLSPNFLFGPLASTVRISNVHTLLYKSTQRV